MSIQHATDNANANATSSQGTTTMTKRDDNERHHTMDAGMWGCERHAQQQTRGGRGRANGEP